MVIARPVLLALWLMLAPTGAQAALSIVGTRFIYHAGNTSLTIRVGNVGDEPVLLQTWLDRGDLNVDPSVVSVPFVLMPPLARIDARSNVALQLRYTGEPLAADRESLFWINFLEVPPKPPDGGDLLKLTHRLRMKVLFRPATLAGNARKAVAQLAWRVRGGTADVPGRVLEASNGTPYFVTLTAVELRLPNHAVAQDGVTVAPFGHVRVPLPAQASDLADGTMVHYTAVGDNGEAISGTSRIQP